MTSLVFDTSGGRWLRGRRLHALLVVACFTLALAASASCEAATESGSWHDGKAGGGTQRRRQQRRLLERPPHEQRLMPGAVPPSLSAAILRHLLVHRQQLEGVDGSTSDSNELAGRDGSGSSGGGSGGLDPDEVAFWIGGEPAAALAAMAQPDIVSSTTRDALAPDEAAFVRGGEPAAAAIASARALAAAADRSQALNAAAEATAGSFQSALAGEPAAAGPARRDDAVIVAAPERVAMDDEAKTVLDAVKEAFAVQDGQVAEQQVQQQQAPGLSPQPGRSLDDNTRTPKVLDAPVPKHPRLYGSMALVPPSIAGGAAQASAKAALEQALREFEASGQAVHLGPPGMALEDEVLLMRLLGHAVPGEFDEAGRLDAADKGYWELLDRQLESHAVVKHLFEPTWYKCGKLNPDLLLRARSVEDMESEGHGHIIAWLGLSERQLPRPGESAGYDELMATLEDIAAVARIVSDPLPFLATTRAPLDRSGMPMLVHVTLKDKGRFNRHHVVALASWTRENPDHTLLLYDDADQEAYIRIYAPSSLSLYLGLRTAVERADLWRYIVMCHHGGVYADADTLCVRPIQEWNSENFNDASVLFGIEDVFRRDPFSPSSGWGVTQGRFGVQFEQWTLAGAPGHPVHCNMANLVKQRLSEPAPAGRADAANWIILHTTGPHVWTDSVLTWMGQHGVGYHEALVPGGRLVANSTRVMPGETFGCAALFFSPGARLEEVYTMHMFRGVWRKTFNEAVKVQLQSKQQLG